MRRRRLRLVVIVALLVALFGMRVAQTLALPDEAPTARSYVAIVRTDGGVDAAVRQAAALAGGLSSVVGPGDLVVVKPNMVMDASGASGMVTDPAVTRAVVRLAYEAGAAQVVIAEGTAQYRDGDLNRDRFATHSAFRAAGYDGDGNMVDDATGVQLIDLNDTGGTDVTDPSKVTKVIIPAGLMRTEYWVPNIVLQADAFISVPVLKNHYNAGVTMGMKNLIGMLPADLYHAPGNVYGKHSLAHGPVDLDRHIVDVNLARKPDFVVIDGQRGMVDGPVGSQIANPPMALILAGRDVVAVDTIGTLVMGYEPRTIPYLDLAAQSGLGTSDPAHISVVGVPVAAVRRDFPAPYGGVPAQRADRQAPSVGLGAPDGEWREPVTVVAEAADNEGVVRVDFYLDGQWIGEATEAPLQLVLDPASYHPGAHTLRAVAYDRCLNEGEVSREVQLATGVSATSPPPSPTVLPITDTPPQAEPATAAPTVTPMPASATPAPSRAASVEPTATRSATQIPVARTPTPEASSAAADQTPTGVSSGQPPAAPLAPGAEEVGPRSASEGAETVRGERRAVNWAAWVLGITSLLLVALGGALLVWGRRRAR